MRLAKAAPRWPLIGLAVVAELTAAHGGAITAASLPGGGAIFTLTLPAS